MKSVFAFLITISFSQLVTASTDKDPVIIADKKQATISVFYPETGQKITQPALFGKVKSDKLDMNVYDYPSKTNYVTPSGSFKTSKTFSWRLGEDMLVFIKGQNAVAAIHPLWKGNPDQKRIERLKSPQIDDNRITGGCINVDSDFFYQKLNTLPEGTLLIVLPE
jgi:hypothetical protein